MMTGLFNFVISLRFCLPICNYDTHWLYIRTCCFCVSIDLFAIISLRHTVFLPEYIYTTNVTTLMIY